MTELITERTMAAQSELIRSLQKEISELKKENKNLKNDLADAEAIMLGNRIIRAGIRETGVSEFSGFQGTWGSPKRAKSAPEFLDKENTVRRGVQKVLFVPRSNKTAEA